MNKSFMQLFREESEQRALAAMQKEVKKQVMIQNSQLKPHQEFIDEDAEDRLADQREQDESDDDGVKDVDDFGEDPELAAIKAKRMAELQKAFEDAQEKKAAGHGEYLDITQDEFLRQVTKSPYVICSFYHREFVRCKIMDKHLGVLAAKHFETKFVRIDAEKTPFFIQKLNIKVLPCVVCFIDGIAVDRLVGFEDFGGKDDFSTKRFAYRLWQAGMIDNEHGERNLPKAAPVKTLLDAVGAGF